MTQVPTVFVAGPAGSGKSTFALPLARRLHAALLDLDTITNPMMEVVQSVVGARSDFNEPELASLTRDARYRALSDGVLDCVRATCPVVAVAPFTAECRDPAVWQHLARQVAAAGGEPLLVWLAVPPEELARRLRQRGASRDVAKLRALEQGESPAHVQPPKAEHVFVDGTASPDAMIDQVLSALGCGHL